jgi:hypothetical protein
MVIEAMVRIYVNLVQNGRRTVDSLPAEYKQPVEAIVNPSASAQSGSANTGAATTA